MSNSTGQTNIKNYFIKKGLKRFDDQGIETDEESNACKKSRVNDSEAVSENNISNVGLQQIECDDDEMLESENECILEVFVSDLESLCDGPKQPLLKEFPSKQIGSERRSFQPSWYKKHNWLEYSISKDAVFCFACRMFNNDCVFTSSGFSTWKKALKSFHKHENSISHKECVVAWSEYERMKDKNTSIMTLVSDAHSKQIQENRHYLGRIIEILLFTARQGIAQRGHLEGADSENKGNFLKLLYFFAKTDELLKRKLEDGKQTEKYTSPLIQNEILHILSNMVLEKISNEVNKAEYFSLQVDETKDISKNEQLSIVLRYYLCGKIFERFIGFVHAKSLNAESLATYVKLKLAEIGIDIHNCVAQTYDGASVMSGDVKGVQKIIRDEVPQAIYTHCINHRLNLVIVDVCKKVKSARRFFAHLQELYVFMSGSVPHEIFVSIQENMKENGGKIIELKRLSDTRWACQYDACEAVKKTLSAIIVTLTTISQENDERAVKANGILKFIDNEFIAHLCIFSFLLKELKKVSDYLQKENCNIAQGILLVKCTQELLVEQKSTSFSDIWKETCLLLEKNGIENSFQAHRTIKLPQHLQNFVLNVNVANTNESSVENSSPEEHFRRKVFTSIMESIDDELSRRFTENSSVVKGMSALNPKSSDFLNIQSIIPFAEHYGCDIDSLKAEVKLFPKCLKRYEQESKKKIVDCVNLTIFLEEYRFAFHELYKLSKITVSSPASSAGCERTFSCMRRIKPYLRNKTSDQRLSDLSILSIERSGIIEY